MASQNLNNLPLSRLPDAVLLRIYTHLNSSPPSPILPLHIPLANQPTYPLSQCSRHLRHLFITHLLHTLDARRSPDALFHIGTFVDQNEIPRSLSFHACRHPRQLKRLIRISGPALRVLHLPSFREASTGVDQILRAAETYATNLETLSFIEDDFSAEGDDDDDDARSRMYYLPSLINRVKNLTVYDPDKIILAALATRPASNLRSLTLHDFRIDSGEVFMHLFMHDIRLPAPRLNAFHVSFAAPLADMTMRVGFLAQAVQYHPDLRDISVLERANILVSQPLPLFPTKDHMRDQFDDLLVALTDVKSGDGIIMSNKPAIARDLTSDDDDPPAERVQPLDRLALFTGHVDTHGRDLCMKHMLLLFEDRIGPETVIELDFQDACMISPPKSSISPDLYFRIVRPSSHSPFIYELADTYFRNVNEICIGMNTLFVMEEPTGRSQIHPPNYDHFRTACVRAGDNLKVLRAGIGHIFQPQTLSPIHETLETLSEAVRSCPNVELLELSQNLIVAEDDDWVLLDILFESLKNLRTLHLIDPRPFLEEMVTDVIFEHLPNLLDTIRERCPHLQRILMNRPIGRGVGDSPSSDCLDEALAAIKGFGEARPAVDTSEMTFCADYFRGKANS